MLRSANRVGSCNNKARGQCVCFGTEVGNICLNCDAGPLQLRAGQNI